MTQPLRAGLTMGRVTAVRSVIQGTGKIDAFRHAHQRATQPVLQGFAGGLDDREIEQLGLPKIQRCAAMGCRQVQRLLAEHIGAAPHLPPHQPTSMGFAIGPTDGARRDIQGIGQLPQGRQAIALAQHPVTDVPRQGIGNRQVHRLVGRA